MQKQTKIKLFAALVIAFVAALSSVGTTPLATQENLETYVLEENVTPMWHGVVMGDVNGDGRVMSGDSTVLAKYLVGHNVDINLRAADIYMDGKVDVFDLIYLAHWLIGKDNYYPKMPRYNMDYRVMINMDANEEVRSGAEWIMNEAVAILRDSVVNVHLNSTASRHTMFEFNKREGCEFNKPNDNCDYKDCLPSHLRGMPVSQTYCRDYHHRSALYFITRYSDSRVYTFRFVDYSLCAMTSSSRTIVNGLAEFQGKDMIVSLNRLMSADGRYLKGNENAVLLTTLHEIGHLLGAMDNNCSFRQRCVMNADLSLRTLRDWCDNCKIDILRHRI